MDPMTETLHRITPDTLYRKSMAVERIANLTRDAARRRMLLRSANELFVAAITLARELAQLN